MMRNCIGFIMIFIIKLIFVVSVSAANFLWEVTKENQTRAYLLGSIHVGQASMFPLPEVMEKAFEKSDHLVVEADIVNINPLEVAAKLQEKAMYKDGRLITDDLSTADMVRLNKVLKSFGLDLVSFSRFKPWYLGVMLTILQAQKLGFKEEYGIDRHFLEQARSNKPILELEGLEFQLNLFDALPMQGLFLTHTLDSLDMMSSMLEPMVEAWKAGDVQWMNQNIIVDMLAENPEQTVIFEKMFFERNVKMVEKLESFFSESGVYFVVVGAGHLVGDEGIVELLKAKGYRIDQL